MFGDFRTLRNWVFLVLHIVRNTSIFTTIPSGFKKQLPLLYCCQKRHCDLTAHFPHRVHVILSKSQIQLQHGVRPVSDFSCSWAKSNNHSTSLLTFFPALAFLSLCVLLKRMDTLGLPSLSLCLHLRPFNMLGT